MSWTINSKTLKTSPAATDSIPIQEAAGTVKRALISWFAQSSWFDSAGNVKTLSTKPFLSGTLQSIISSLSKQEGALKFSCFSTVTGGQPPSSVWTSYELMPCTDQGINYFILKASELFSKSTFVSINTGTAISSWTPSWVQLTDASGNAVFPSVATTASAANAYIGANGTTILKSTSSAKYKTDIVDLEDSDALDLMRPVLYKSNPETVPGDDPEKEHYGFIAEELHEIDEKLVQYVDGVPDGVQYDRITVLLVKRIHELEARLAKAGI